MHIVGISGVAGSGKDTIGGFLRTDHQYVSISLADPMKRILREVFDFSEDQLWGPSQKRNEPDLRYPRKVPSFDTDDAFEADCYGIPDPGKIEYLTPRFALQTLGTAFGRACYPDVWIDITMRIAKQLLGQNLVEYSPKKGIYSAYLKIPEFHGGVVIPDVRFKNEMDGIRAGGGKVIRVIRQGSGLSGIAGKHVSETEQASIPDDYFDRVIINNGTLDDLGEKVSMMVSAFAV